MVRPSLRSRSLKRKKLRTPGNNKVTHYEKKKPKAARCAECGKPLHGVPRIAKKLPKSKRRPDRPYGGNLCSECMREVFRERVQNLK